MEDENPLPCRLDLSVTCEESLEEDGTYQDEEDDTPLTRILKLARRLVAVGQGVIVAPPDEGDPSAPVVELKRQLEDEIAVEDPYCGEVVVRHLTKPFILPDEADEAASWAL